MRLALFCVLLLALCGCAFGQPEWPSSEYSSSPPGPLITGHWSETANYAQYRPSYEDSTGQSECPFNLPGLVSWSDTGAWDSGAVPSDGEDALLAENTLVLLTAGDVSPTDIFGLITIPATSALIFDDEPITLQAHGFDVLGNLTAGSPTCRLQSKISITLWGERGGDVTDPTVKGIAVRGAIDIHGNQYFPTWTRLATTAAINSTTIWVQDLVNWQPGQEIVITTTTLKDSRDYSETEVRIIDTVQYYSEHPSSVSVITLTEPLEFQHYAGTEYQAEVALLSRDILIQGDPDSEPTDNITTCYDLDDPDVIPATSTYPCENQFLTGYGGHIQVIGSEAQGRFSGVELYRMGQTNVLARYPLHFHMMFEQDPSTASISDCSVHRSFYRCFVIHGTNNTLVTQNTAYDAIGNCFYLSENGVEEGSTISYNFAAFVHPLGNPALPSFQDPDDGFSWLDGNGWYGQYLDFFLESEDLLIPADLSAACFYITNGHNNIFGNAAAGGWTGFSFPSLINPISNFKNLTNFSPQGRPFLTPFRGNTAHSSGFWWASAGAFYFGGQLDYYDEEKTILRYTAGRSETHDTCSDSTVTTGCYGELQLWLELEDNKAFLANRGLQAWGNRADIIRFEMHDVALSMNVFGQVWIDQLLMECRSANIPRPFGNCPAAESDPTPDYYDCNIRDFYFFRTLHGFQWYDVGQDHILTNSIFRNCASDWEGCVFGDCDNSVFQSLTHSDEFVPENMQITKNITFENCNNLRSYTTDSTGNPLNETVSGRLQNWLDWDGTISDFGVKSQIGSARSYHWWDYNGSCPVSDEAYMCAQAEGDGQASIFFAFDYAYQQLIGEQDYCPNGGDPADCPVVGEVIHFGRGKNTGLVLGLNSKLTGPVIHEAGGWFINLTDGTPRQVNFTSISIDPDFNLVLALPYPSGTLFNITYEAAGWCGSWATCTFPFEEADDLQSVYEGIGNLYYFADNILYIRITMQPSYWELGAEFTAYTDPAVFSRDGLSIFLASQSYVSILADCVNDPCDVQDVDVPNAINPRSTSTATTTTETTGTDSTQSSSTVTYPVYGTGAVSKSSFTTLRTQGTGTSSDESSGSGCFAASSSVRVMNGQDQVTSKRLSELAVGDLVESFEGEKLVFSPVYYVAHAGDEKKVEIVTLKVEESATALKLTPHHLLLAASNLLASPELKPAGEVKVGEFLFLVSESGALTRAKVASSNRGSEAVRNPLTLNNNIVVSGFACSAFAQSATFYSIITRPAQMLYELLPSAFEPNTLLTSFIDALVVVTDWIESKNFASIFVASADSW